MTDIVKKNYRRLQVAFTATFLSGIALFVCATLLRLREIVHGGSPSIVMERYGILVTLIAIPSSLKVYHYFVRKIAGRPEASRLSSYSRAYFFRLSILTLALLFDFAGLYVTGSRNFFYMFFVVLMAFLFCLPNKSEIATLCDKSDMPSQAE